MKKQKQKFKVEFRKQLRLAFAAAVGFIIAFSWRNFIFELTRDWVIAISTFLSPNLINLVTSLIITFFGVLVIWFSSKVFK